MGIMRSGERVIPQTENRIVYKFSFADGSSKEFAVRLDHETLSLIAAPRESYPTWTALGFMKCANCPLDEAKHARCPIATNLVDLVEFFKDSISYEEADVCVDTGPRQYLSKTSLQKGISALMGIFMVTSGCPIMDRLRPMVDTHLPFATAEETTYRFLCMYLMSQYFRAKHGLRHDLDFKGLLRVLADIRQVDVDFCRRLRSIQINDASINALVILNTLGEMTSLSIEENDLSRMERIFMERYGNP